MSTQQPGGLPDSHGGYGDRDPYGSDSSAGWSHSAPEDPYAVGPDGTDPYASEPLDADGFGPVFGSSAENPAGGGAVAMAGAGQPYSGQQHPGQAYPGHQHPAPYPGPQGYGPYAPPPPSSGAAITSLVLGLLALTLCAGLTAPVGLVFAAKGMKETGPSAPAPKGGRGLAIAGLVTSLIGLLPLLIFVFYIVIFVLAIFAEMSGA